MTISDFPLLTRSKRVSPKTLDVLKRIDTVIAHRDKTTEALAKEIGEAELAALPQVVEEACGPAHPELAKVLHKIAVLYHATYQIEKAKVTYRKAVSCAQEAFPLPTLEMGLLLNNFGRLMYEQKSYVEAEDLYLRALEVLKQAVGPQHRKLSTPMSNLSELYQEIGEHDLSRIYLQDTIALLEQNLGPNHRKVIQAKERLAVLKQ